MKQKGGSQAGSDYPVGRTAGDTVKFARCPDAGYSRLPLTSRRSATAPLADIMLSSETRSETR